ncbi:MAG: dipeptide epimerase [Elusimicrobiota bacterium]
MSKISGINFYIKTYKYQKPFHITNSISTEAKNVEVEIITNDGFKGYGEVSPSFRVNGETTEQIRSLLSKVKEMILGFDTRNYLKLFEITDKLISSCGLKAALQFAVLDCLCEEYSCGVWEFLGGMKNEIETDKTVSIGKIEERIKDAIEIYKSGFKTIKIKVGENLNEDIEAVIEIAKKTKGARYIVDANMGYSPKEAVHFAKTVYSKGVDVAIFEQPVVWYDIDGLKYVRFNSPYPVAADESAKTKYDVLKLIKNEAVDYVNIKLMKSGISDGLSIVKLCEAANIKLMIGCMAESSIGVNQSVHFACGLGVFEFCDLDSHLMLSEKEYRGKFKQIKNKMLV